MTNQEQYKDWIKNNLLDHEMKIEENKAGNVVIKAKHATGNVNFYDNNIIELSADNNITNEPAFYLHFQLNDLNHAKSLFLEMVECMRSIHSKQTHHILFSCTSGLTTGYFAELCNQAFEVLKSNYHVDAVSVDRIEESISDCELLCIAPQASYKVDELHQKFPHVNIIQIPPQIFARYETGEMVKLIQDHVEKPLSLKIERPHSYRNIEKHEHPILCLSVIRNSRRTHIIYAVYDSNNFVVFNNEVIKPTIDLVDIYDAIDMSLATIPDITCIGMSLPGIINKERFIAANYVTGLNDHNLDELFTNKYHKKFVFTNDANAAAVGFYSTHNQYESLSFIYQPLYYRSGVGSVIDGKLLTGAHNLSGEIKLVPLELSKPFLELIKDTEGAIELISKQIITLITTIDPEAIVICSQLLPNVEVLKEPLIKYLGHQNYLPDLIEETQFHMYMFSGQLILCIQSLEEDKQRA